MFSDDTHVQHSCCGTKMASVFRHHLQKFHPSFARTQSDMSSKCIMTNRRWTWSFTTVIEEPDSERVHVVCVQASKPVPEYILMNDCTYNVFGYGLQSWNSHWVECRHFLSDLIIRRRTCSRVLLPSISSIGNAIRIADGGIGHGQVTNFCSRNS